MHNIGNDHDALTIYSWVRSHPVEYGRPTCVNDEEAPQGWEYLGKGSFRSVWLSPEGVAYKVEHESDERYAYQSTREVENLRSAWEKGALEGCRLPKFQKYDTPSGDIVVAIEHIKGETVYRFTRKDDNRNHWYDLMNKAEDYYRLQDMHDENAMVDEDGLLVVIDFGG